MRVRKALAPGYWCVFIEGAEMLIGAEHIFGPADLEMHQYDLLDGSIGKHWSAYRQDKPWMGRRVPGQAPDLPDVVFRQARASVAHRPMLRRYMPPRLVAGDLAGHGGADAERPAQVCIRLSFSGQPPYLSDVGFGQLGRVIPFPPGGHPVPRGWPGSAMADAVGDVFGAGAPDKVLRPVVRRVAVQVPAFHALRARADERFEDQVVDGSPDRFPPHVMATRR
jgi:hypothetical protein